MQVPPPPRHVSSCVGCTMQPNAQVPRASGTPPPLHWYSVSGSPASLSPPQYSAPATHSAIGASSIVSATCAFGSTVVCAPPVPSTTPASLPAATMPTSSGALPASSTAVCTGR